MFNKDDIKNNLSIDEVFEFVSNLGGEPRMVDAEKFISKTICHNEIGQGSHKLYYYDNTKLFKCFTECDSTFDIFELVEKVKRKSGLDFSLFQAIRFVAQYFGIETKDENFYNNELRLSDKEIFDNYAKIQENKIEKKEVSFKEIDISFLKNLPRPHILNWEKEGTTKEVIDNREICYDPYNHGVIIPHFDSNGRAIGIRERTLVKEKEQYGKYRPAFINKRLYNHALGLNLYNLNFSKDNIAAMGVGIIFEGEKSCLAYASIFGVDNDITVAPCGNSLTDYQINLLIDNGAKEIVIAFDKQYENLTTDEAKRWIKKLEKINDRYSKKVNISFMFDKGNLLDYKDSPIDKGRDIFLQLFKERIVL